MVTRNFQREEVSEAGLVLSILPAVIVLTLIFITAGLGYSQFQRFITLQDSAARLSGSASLRAIADWTLGDPPMGQAVLDAANGAAQELYSNSSNLFTNGLDTVGFSLYPDTSGSHGMITAGVWHFLPPLDCSAFPSGPCPCPSGAWAGPCMEKLSMTPSSSLTTPTPTAVEVQLKTASGNPFTTGISLVLNSMDVRLQTQVTVAERRIRSVVLMDLSRSSHNETHVPFDGDTNNLLAPHRGYASESAFELASVTCPGDNSNPCVRSIPGPPLARCFDECQILGQSFPVNHPYLNPFMVLYNSPCAPNNPAAIPPVTGASNITYRFMMTKTGGASSAVGIRPAGALPNQYHFQSDYRCYNVSLQEVGGPAKTGNFLIDTCGGSCTPGIGTLSGTYDGPEPLTTMLTAVSGGIDALTARKGINDTFGLIGFDSTAMMNIRRVDPTDTSLLTDLRVATDVTMQTAGALKKRFEQFGLFVRRESSTNLPQALEEAHAMITADTSVEAQSADRVVVLVSDGISNCTAEGVCGGAATDYDLSMEQVEGIIRTKYVADKIRLHWIHIGSRARPHTMLVKSEDSPGRCMGQEEADNRVPPLKYVKTDTVPAVPYVDSALTSEDQFYDPLRLYSLVRETRGKYFAIRPPCVSGTDVTPTLDTACGLSSGVVSPPGSDNPVGVSSPPHTDPEGRLLCEPRGQGRRDQIRAAMNEIYSLPNYYPNRIGARKNYLYGYVGP